MNVHQEDRHYRLDYVRDVIEVRVRNIKKVQKPLFEGPKK